MKPGFLTSEFWVMIAKLAVTVLISIGVISADKGDAATTAIADALTALGAFIANAWVVISYIRARQVLKAQATGGTKSELGMLSESLSPSGVIPPLLVNLIFQALLTALPQLVQMLQNWINSQYKATPDQANKLAQVEAKLAEAASGIASYRARGGVTP